MSTTTISPLRQRMIEDMTARKFGPASQRSHIESCERNVIARNGIEPLRRSIEAAEKAGGGARVMCHIGGVETPRLMSDILDLLRPGDILTHADSGAPKNGRAFTNIAPDSPTRP